AFRMHFVGTCDEFCLGRALLPPGVRPVLRLGLIVETAAAPEWGYGPTRDRQPDAVRFRGAVPRGRGDAPTARAFGQGDVRHLRERPFARSRADSSEAGGRAVRRSG